MVLQVLEPRLLIALIVTGSIQHYIDGAELAS
jgi:hypothetical protein